MNKTPAAATAAAAFFSASVVAVAAVAAVRKTARATLEVATAVDVATAFGAASPVAAVVGAMGSVIFTDVADAGTHARAECLSQISNAVGAVRTRDADALLTRHRQNCSRSRARYYHGALKRLRRLE